MWIDKRKSKLALTYCHNCSHNLPATIAPQTQTSPPQPPRPRHHRHNPPASAQPAPSSFYQPMSLNTLRQNHALRQNRPPPHRTIMLMMPTKRCHCQCRKRTKSSTPKNADASTACWTDKVSVGVLDGQTGECHW